MIHWTGLEKLKLSYHFGESNYISVASILFKPQTHPLNKTDDSSMLNREQAIQFTTFSYKFCRNALGFN